MKAIVYFHGFGSTGYSNTVTHIRNCIKYEGYKVISPTYNTKNADKGYEKLDEFINSIKKEYEELYFIGSSLGGFFANYFSMKYKVPVILINPTLDPYNSLKKYNLEESELETFKKYYIENTQDIEKIVILGGRDTTIPWKTHLDVFKSNNYEIFINSQMEHRVSKIEEICPAINKLINDTIREIH